MKKTLFVYQLKNIENYTAILNILAFMNIEFFEIEDEMIHLKIKDLMNHKIRNHFYDASLFFSIIKSITFNPLVFLLYIKIIKKRFCNFINNWYNIHE